MAWTSPRTWVASETVTAAVMNSAIRDNLLWLASTTGLVQHEAGGVEVDISAVAKGGLVAGTGAGTMALRTVGANGKVLQADSAEATGLIWGGGPLALAGSNLVESTTTSLTEVDLSLVGSLSIATTKPLLIYYSWRRTTGAATTVSLGLKINATVVRDAQAVIVSINAAASGHYVWFIGPQTASHLRAAIGLQANGSIGSADDVMGLGADMPNATITSVTVRGLVGDAAVTLGTTDLFVFTLPTV